MLLRKKELRELINMTRPVLWVEQVNGDEFCQEDLTCQKGLVAPMRQNLENGLFLSSLILLSVLDQISGCDCKQHWNVTLLLICSQPQANPLQPK